MVTCQSSELGWEVTVELSVDFLSLGRGPVNASVPDQLEGARPGLVPNIPTDIYQLVQ